MDRGSFAKGALVGLAAAMLVAGLAVGGYVLGDSQAATKEDAAEAHAEAWTDAARRSDQAARPSAERRGKGAGRRSGRTSGQRVGGTRGAQSADKAVAEIQVEQQQEETEPTETELVPCVLGDGLCTPEEKQERIDREAYCGGFDPSRVQPDGGYLPKPGC